MYSIFMCIKRDMLLVCCCFQSIRTFHIFLGKEQSSDWNLPTTDCWETAMQLCRAWIEFMFLDPVECFALELRTSYRVPILLLIFMKEIQSRGACDYPAWLSWITGMFILLRALRCFGDLLCATPVNNASMRSSRPSVRGLPYFTITLETDIASRRHKCLLWTGRNHGFSRNYCSHVNYDPQKPPQNTNPSARSN